MTAQDEVTESEEDATMGFHETFPTNSDISNLRRAALEIGAVNLGNGWAHRDDGTRRWYRVTEEQLEELGAMLAASEPDAYSRWCSENLATEMPAEWQP